MDSSEILKLSNYNNVYILVNEARRFGLTVMVNIIFTIINSILLTIAFIVYGKYVFVFTAIILIIIQIAYSIHAYTGTWIGEDAQCRFAKQAQEINDKLQFPVACVEDDKYIQQIFYDEHLLLLEKTDKINAIFKYDKEKIKYIVACHLAGVECSYILRYNT